MNPIQFKFKYILWAIFLLFFFVLPILANFYTNWLWFLELGFETIFLTTLFAKISIAVVSGFVIFLILYLNIFLFRRLTNNEPIEISLNKDGYVQTLNITKLVNRLVLPVSLLFGVFGGITFASSWQTVLLFLNKVSFGVLDPIFNKDISFYVFSVPFFEVVFATLSFVLFISFAVAVFLYLAKGALVIKNRASLTVGSLGSNLLTINREARIHLFILIAFWFVLGAFKIYFIKIPNILLSKSGLFVGAAYSDINATLPILYVLFAVSLIAAGLALLSIKKGGIKLIVSSFVVYIGVSFLGLSVYPSLLQGFVVKPNELNKETPYIEHHIKATQEAWGISEIQERSLSGDSALTMSDIEKNEATIANIRLWDRGPLLDTFGQLQEIRTYYDFVSADSDRYMIDGDYRQVLLSPRELNSESLPQRNFINERLSFTHGMGLALSPVNEKTEEGLPVLFVKDLPPSSEKEELKIERPEIYFGEMSNDYVIVNTKAKEFDYPSGEENIYASYEGSGGVEISSIFKKALFALKFDSLKILLSNDITKESRILYNRNIQERAQKAFQFLTFDGDPYVVIDEGKMMWVYDAYTTSGKYPYSETIGGRNYMRNSVKVVIDAYSGGMQAYVADPNDPIIQSFSAIFHDIFLPIDSAPESLRAHFRYPEDIFTYQTALYSIYHMEEPQIFYNKEDLWEIPRIKGSTRGEDIGPIMRHLIMKLPGEEKEEFIFMVPFTPKGKNNMSAWVAARSDGEHYGELVAYTFPKQSLVFGPEQIVNRINQDADISRQISLWDQRGSEVLQGNLSVIPINESILYIRPLYLRAEGGKIPELKRVIVAYENQIAMEETLDLALSNIFTGLKPKGGQESTNKKEPEVSDTVLIRQANQHFINAEAALRSSNWTLYGEEIKKLGEILKKIQ